MFDITCPHCSESRSGVEFEYVRDAHAARPHWDGSARSDEDFDDLFRYVYVRRNPCGRSLEYWQHRAGCRGWLLVTRDTASHAILETGPVAAVSRTQQSTMA